MNKSLKQKKLYDIILIKEFFLSKNISIIIYAKLYALYKDIA